MIYDKKTNTIKEHCNRCGGVGYVVSPYDPTDSGNCPECNKTGYTETVCHPSCKELWEDGREVVEGEDYELQFGDGTTFVYNPKYPEAFKHVQATPIQEESEDEVWDEVMQIIGAWRPAFDAEMNKLKQSFTIKRKV